MRDTKQMADTMNLVNTNLSKEVHKFVGDKVWPGHLWAGRYHHVPVTDEELVQIARLRYALEQAVEAGLVDRPSQWPGVHSVDALLSGEPLRGIWYDRTKQWAASQRRQQQTYPKAVELHFSPLPCWAHLPPEEVRRRVAKPGASNRGGSRGQAPPGKGSTEDAEADLGSDKNQPEEASGELQAVAGTAGAWKATFKGIS